MSVIVCVHIGCATDDEPVIRAMKLLIAMVIATSRT